MQAGDGGLLPAHFTVHEVQSKVQSQETFTPRPARAAPTRFERRWD